MPGAARRGLCRFFVFLFLRLLCQCATVATIPEEAAQGDIRFQFGWPVIRPLREDDFEQPEIVDGCTTRNDQGHHGEEAVFGCERRHDVAQILVVPR